MLIILGAIFSSGDDEPEVAVGEATATTTEAETSTTTEAETTTTTEAETSTTTEAETTTTTEPAPPPKSESDDVERCSILDENTIELEIVNNSSETSSYSIVTVYRDQDGGRLGDEVHFINHLRPDERTIEPVFAFDVQGTTCDVADVERFSSESKPDELDDADSCSVTGRDFADDLTAEVIVTNNSSKTSDYSIDIAFVQQDGVRIGTGSAFINAVAAGETAPGEVFSVVSGDATVCEVVAVYRSAT